MDELKKVFGWAEYTSHPGWDEDFTTIIGGCQQIDAAYASRDVLRAFGIPDDFVDRFLQAPAVARTESMEQPTTAQMDPNGVSFPCSASTASRTAGNCRVNGIQSLIVFKSPNPVFRIVSVGKSGNVTRSVQMIVLKQRCAQGVGCVRRWRPSSVFSWKEL